MRPRRPRWRPDAVGVLLATAAATLALTPGLLPRDGVTQGVVSGVAAAVGYGLGAGLSALLSAAAWRPGRRLSAAVPVAAAVAFVPAVAVAAGWQREAAALTGTAPPSTASFLLAVPVTAVVAAVPVLAGRGLRGLARGLRRRGVPAPGLAVALVVVLLVGAAGWAAVGAAERASRARDDEPGPVDGPPAAATRSGSAASLVPWTTLGRDGRRFVAGGRPPGQLAAASGRPARDPVRVYVGLASAPDPRARAALAVAELDRAGGFDRGVLALATPTGTGAVDPQVPDTLELVRGGDAATVAVQYATLPSDLDYALGGTGGVESTRALLDAVRERLATRPPERRPRLLVYGQSLGALGSQAAFASLDDVTAQVDGALWAGPPHASPLWAGLVARRDPGSPEVLPVVDGGRTVRFAGRPGDLDGTRARVVYLQHPSDPVVWASPDLFWRRPSWLAEPRGADVPPSVRWWPLVTGWQTVVDLARAQSVPPDHGHRYDALLVDGWAAVAAPPGWTAADTARAREAFGR
ncbi:alpha/beta hydrolase [Actinomycetospora chlora]|uniref:Alpha/beta hydrolase n=1 Tax=Actinomycetospora chlora TaxID=663608 RepID=A0ABP9AD30_9PSEU